MKLGILKAYADKHELYEAACNELGVDHSIIDILKPGWIEEIRKSGCDGFLCHPPDDIQEHKSLHDEKIWLINKILNFPVYPDFESLYIYENKRNMIYWLLANNIPHPQSWVLARKKDAQILIDKMDFPLVFKANVGAGASGVEIVNSRSKARRIANQVFGRFHPALTFGRLRFGGRLKIPMPLFGRIQKHYLIIQKFYHIRWEWRIIKIGDYYAAHKKLLKKNFASGSNLVGWDNPPLEILEMARQICEKGNFYSMGVDIFETQDGKFLVNELQALFGSYNTHQMKVDGKPGIYKYENNEFSFIQGDFHQHGSNVLRVNHFLEILKNRQDQ